MATIGLKYRSSEIPEMPKTGKARRMRPQPGKDWSKEVKAGRPGT